MRRVLLIGCLLLGLGRAAWAGNEPPQVPAPVIVTGIKDDVSQDIVYFRMDPTTKALLVKISAAALPAGASTAAKQDVAAAILTTMNAFLSTLSTKDYSTAAKQDLAKAVLDTIAAKDFSTAANQTTGNGKLDTLIAKDYATQTTLAALLAATATAATAANQVTANASLSSMDTKLSSQATAAKQDTLITNTTGLATSAKQDTLSAKFGVLGQTNMVGSAPVVLASDQSAIPASQSGTWNVTNVSGTVSLPTGASTEATLSALNGKVTAVNTGAVVVSASALPTGAATEVTLAALNGKVTAVNTGAIAGTVTANAGTNLNTSALALETGGNLATVVTNTGNSGSIYNKLASIDLNEGFYLPGIATTATNTGATATNTGSLILAQGSTTSGQTGPIVMGATTTAAPTYVTAKTNPLSLTTGGALRNTGTSDYTDGTADSSLNTATTVMGIVKTAAPTYLTNTMKGLSLNTSGGLRVDGSGATQPVSGTFWQATQPVSTASLPLPSGAATSALQPSLGTAGTASSNVITVQGIASMTPLLATVSGTVNQGGYSNSNITTSTTTTIVSGAGTIHALAINGLSVGGTAVIYNNTAGSGTIIGTVNTTANIGSVLYDVNFDIGLTVVTTGAPAADISVSYR